MADGPALALARACVHVCFVCCVCVSVSACACVCVFVARAHACLQIQTKKTMMRDLAVKIADLQEQLKTQVPPPLTPPSPLRGEWPRLRGEGAAVGGRTD